MRTEPGNVTPSEDGRPLRLSADNAAQTPTAQTAPLTLLTMVTNIYRVSPQGRAVLRIFFFYIIKIAYFTSIYEVFRQPHGKNFKV